jgi:hypothetical protein
LIFRHLVFGFKKRIKLLKGSRCKQSLQAVAEKARYGFPAIEN